MTKMLQRRRHFGKLRDPEELVVRCHLRYLADVLAELRRQPGHGSVGATGLPEHVAKNNTRFSARVLLDFGGPLSSWGPTGGPDLVLHQRVVRLKDLGICSEARHLHQLLSPRKIAGTARLQPARAAMSSLSRTWRTSRQCFPLLGGLAGDAGPGADPGPKSGDMSGTSAPLEEAIENEDDQAPGRNACGGAWWVEEYRLSAWE